MSTIAFARDFFCADRKFLLYNLIMRNLKIRYRKSLLGMLWTVLIPAGSALVYFIVFRFVLNVQIPNYLLHILSGIIPWTFFSASISTGLECIVNNHQLLNKVPLPPHTIVFSEVLTHLLNFLLSLPVIIVVMALTRVLPTPAIIQVIPLLVCLFLMSYSISLILGITYVYFRDLKHLMTIILQFWFYLTPIMYRVEMIPNEYRDFLYFNPIGSLFSGLHLAIAEGKFLDSTGWTACLIWTAGLLALASCLVKKFKHRIVELL